MTSILKVDQIQTAAGGVPTLNSIGLNANGTILNTANTYFNTRIQVDGQTEALVWTTQYTPVSTNSILLVAFKAQINSWHLGGAEARFETRLLLDGSEIHRNNYCGTYDYGGSGTWSKGTYSADITVANTTTSQRTFTLYMRSRDDYGSVAINDSSWDRTSITIYEIAG